MRNRDGRAAKAIQKRYRQQKGRGQSGFGYVTAKDGKLENVARSTTETGIMLSLREETSNSILFHHRTPTSTGNYVEATHPFLISDARFKHDYYIAHNGVIQNWESLFEKYKKDGYVFLSEMRESSVITFPHIEGSRYEDVDEIKINDSEALCINLAEYFEGKTNTIDARGTIAFIAWKIDKDSGTIKEMIYGHNDGNPLKVEKDKTLFCLRSEGAGKDVPVDVMHFMDWQSGDITTCPIKIGEFYGRKTMGFGGGNVDKQDAMKPIVGVPSRGPMSNYERMIRWEADDERETVTQRMLHPDHPVLPLRQLNVGNSLKEMGAAMARAKAEEDNDGEYGEMVSNIERDFSPPEDEAEQEQEYYSAENISETIAEEELERFLFEKIGEPEKATELRKELRRALYDMRGSAREVEEARILLKIAADDFQYGTGTIDDVEEIKELLTSAETQYKDHKRDVICIKSELTAWIKK